MSDLPEFLGEFAKRKFDWGACCNCLTICADWIVAKTGDDPFARYRNVRTKKEARRVLRQAGGDVAFMSRILVRFPVTTEPRAGDVALVRAPTRPKGKLREVGAIALGGGRFALLTADLGLLVAPVPLVKAWSIDG